MSKNIIKIANELVSKNKLTEKDIEKFNRKIKSSATKKFLKSD